MSDDIRECIAAANGKLIAAFKRGDATGMANAYTADAMLAPPHSDFARHTSDRNVLERRDHARVAGREA